jgi:RNA polymerase sigma factor (sigma-70 family)
LDNHHVIESDLIKGCISGDRKMQEYLYYKFSPKMYAVCLRYSNNTDDAQDLLQDGFIKVFKNLDKYRGDGSFEGWMRRIFVNTSIEQFRKKTKMTTVAEPQEHNIEDKELGALDTIAEKDVIKIIQKLSPGYKQVFNMYVIEGYTHKEIGDILGISEGTSKSQLARAKVILQKMVEEKLYLN